MSFVDRKPKLIFAPGDDIDEMAVQIVLNGRPPYPWLTRPEVLEVCRRMTIDGYSAAEIGERLYATKRAVSRWREELRARKELDETHRGIRAGGWDSPYRMQRK